jgi:hypothetical protein
VRKRHFWPLFISNRSYYQDRLGTKHRESSTQKRDRFVAHC